MIIIDIIVKRNSKENIYEQIVIQIKQQIAINELTIGESVPSIRKLSQKLGVSLISVQRAYDELQNEGVIESVAGKGCFVSAKVDKSFLKDSLLKEVEEAAIKAINTSKQNSVTMEEFLAMIKVLWEEERLE